MTDLETLADYSRLQSEIIKKCRAELEEYIKANGKPIFCKHCFWGEQRSVELIFCKRYMINKRVNGFCDLGTLG